MNTLRAPNSGGDPSKETSRRDGPSIATERHRLTYTELFFAFSSFLSIHRAAARNPRSTPSFHAWLGCLAKSFVQYNLVRQRAIPQGSSTAAPSTPSPASA